MDEKISETPILDQKLNEFGAEVEIYKVRAKHMRLLNAIYKKHLNNIELSRSDLKFLYEVEEKIQGFGFGKHPRVDEILKHRNLRKDISFALDIRPDQISLTQEEFSQGQNIIYHHGHLLFRDLKSATGLTLPKYVSGSLDLGELTSAEDLLLPQYVGEDLVLGMHEAKDLVLPKYVGGELTFEFLTHAERLIFPDFVGRSLGLSSLTNAKGLVLPRYVGEFLDLFFLISADGLVFPQYTGGDIYLFSLKSMVGLNLDNALVSDKVKLDSSLKSSSFGIEKEYPHIRFEFVEDDEADNQ